MLDVLISFNTADMVLGVDTDNNIKGETLLQIACRTGSKATINFLLKRGADLYLPETDNNALTTLLIRLKTQTERRDDLWDKWSLIQLVEHHLPEAGKEMRDHYMLKAQTHAPVHKGTSHDYVASRTDSATPETQLRLRMERIDGENFEYAPLSGRGALRTMILHPAKDPDALIECELVRSEYCLTPEYEALSYVWGNSNVPRYIKLDGKVFQITTNLYEALLALRQEYKPRRLWVDAICINQSDNDERNQQVTLMGDIYMGASRVVIWLGTASQDSHLVFQHLARFRQHQEDVKSGRCRPTDRYGESHINPPLYEGATRAALEGLFQRPWFFRTWVIQEKVLSKEAIIYCGSESASWEELFRPSTTSYWRHNERPLHGLDCNERAHQIRDFRPSNNLETCRAVLEYSRDCQVSDPKDRVYGILGLLKPGLIKVKYELDVQEIYRSFTQAVIEDSGNLDILNLCGTKHALPGLPSWVPDFNARRSSCHVPGLTEINRSYTVGEPQPEKHVTKALPGLRFRNNGKELVVKGKAVDTVRAVGDEMLVSKEYALDTEKFSQTLAGWESLAIDNLLAQGSNTTSTSADPRSTVSHAFLATLAALNTVFGTEPEHKTYMPMGGVLWYKQHGTGALMRRESQYFEDLEYCMMLRERATDDSSYRWYARELERAVYGRKLFVTEGGSLGLGEPSIRAGDEIVFLTGSMYPVTIRKLDGDTSIVLGDCYVYGFDILKLFNDAEKPIIEYIFQ